MGDASSGGHCLSQFFFAEINRIETIQKGLVISREYSREEILAGFDRLERFGFINSLPSLVEHFAIPRNEVLKLKVSEVYLALQYISILNDCRDRLSKIK